MAQALDYARVSSDDKLRRDLSRLALRLFPPERDRGFPEDRSRGFGFIAPYLSQADLMRRVLQPKAFRTWFEGFFPRFPKGWERPDLSWEADGHYQDHKWGLMFYKAAAARGVAQALGASHPLFVPLLDAARHHADAGRAKLATAFDIYDAAHYGDRLDLGDEPELERFMDEFYAAGHWLSAYALYEQTGVGLEAP
jgi:Protein of unknown function (DUF2891)